MTRITSHPNDDLGPVLLVLTCVLTSIAVITTCLRCVVRYSRHILGWDDGAIVLTMLLMIARMALQIVSVQYGNGKHRTAITHHAYQVINMLTWYTQVLLFPTLCVLKISICILLLRIKDTRRLRCFIGSLIAGLVLTNFECLVVLLAQCKPISAYWTGNADQCWRPTIRIYSIYVQASYSVLSDLACTILPVVVVWNVQIPIRTKLAVCGLMSMGIVATMCSIMRAASLRISTSDLSYAYCLAAIWANTEILLGIIAANLALARSMVKYFSERARTLTPQSHVSETNDITNLRNSFVNPSHMGYIKSPESSSCVAKEHEQSGDIQLRNYSREDTFQDIDKC